MRRIEDAKTCASASSDAREQAAREAEDDDVVIVDDEDTHDARREPPARGESRSASPCGVHSVDSRRDANANPRRSSKNTPRPRERGSGTQQDPVVIE